MQGHRRVVGAREELGREASLENLQLASGGVHQFRGGVLGPLVQALPHALAPVEFLGDCGWAKDVEGVQEKATCFCFLLVEETDEKQNKAVYGIYALP